MTSKEMAVILEKCGTNIEDSDLENEIIKRFNTLAKRDTPMKVIMIDFNAYCDNCGNNLFRKPQTYCDECGQLLDWSDFK